MGNSDWTGKRHVCHKAVNDKNPLHPSLPFPHYHGPLLQSRYPSERRFDSSITQFLPRKHVSKNACPTDQRATASGSSADERSDRGRVGRRRAGACFCPGHDPISKLLTDSLATCTSDAVRDESARWRRGRLQLLWMRMPGAVLLGCVAAVGFARRHSSRTPVDQIMFILHITI